MKLADILLPQNVCCDNKTITSKKQILEYISNFACKQFEEANYVEILQALLQREKIGTTAVGHGVAIPHARTDNINAPFCCLFTLHKAINYDAEEPTAIDVVFGLLVPIDATEEHLQILSTLATHLQDKSYRSALRAATTNEELLKAATA